MEEPLVSIVVCTYNGERFIEDQLRSLLQQTYQHIEIIVSDDASSDGTVSLLSSYSSHPKCRVLLHKENVGFIKNFERGMAVATGTYIALCDQDDSWLPEKIQLLCQHIGDSSGVYCDSELINERGERLGKKISDIKHMYSGTDARGFVITNMVSGHALMIRREVLNRALPLPSSVFHDEWLTVHATVLNGIRYVDKPLVLYRQHEKNITQIVMNKRARSRTRNNRWNALLRKLQWISLLGSIQREEDKPFYTRLYGLFEQKKKGRFVWPLFFFLLKHRQPLFQHTRKNFISQLVEIRKLARGEQKEED
ncbi:MAG: glycosyltransferase family 2 protein [Williamsia sp.]|nr:glycosyltransferase family 2 protein [Williamsia sp.]